MGVDEDVLLLGLEGSLEVFLAEKFLVGWNGLLDIDGGHVD
jgi:hypothetical protein